MIGPLAVSQEDSPCELHGSHRPMTWINERHHIFPEYLQRRVWGETRVNMRSPICATGHNNVHACLEDLLEDRPFRHQYARSEVRLARLGFEMYTQALDDATPGAE